MYYLTESNGIISDEQIKKINGACLVGTTLYDDEFQVIDRIKKQSENVYDLINVGDLIEFITCEEIEITNVRCMDKINNKNFIITRGYIHNGNDIKAIYKPNSKGDYIKVWEKE